MSERIPPSIVVDADEGVAYELLKRDLTIQRNGTRVRLVLLLGIGEEAIEVVSVGELLSVALADLSRFPELQIGQWVFLLQSQEDPAQADVATFPDSFTFHVGTEPFDSGENSGGFLIHNLSASFSVRVQFSHESAKISNQGTFGAFLYCVVTTPDVEEANVRAFGGLISE